MIEFILIICKICNLDGVRIIIKREDGLIDDFEIDLIERCDLISECGVELFRMYLIELMDRILLERSVEFEFVDVGFLIFFFKMFIGFILMGRFK